MVSHGAEGDTLAFTTIGVKGWDTDHDSILDRTGLIISSAMHSMTRMRKINDNTIEAQITIEDPKALTKPWVVTRRYTRMPKGTRVYDYACGENNRNPVDETGRTLTLGPDGRAQGNLFAHKPTTVGPALHVERNDWTPAGPTHAAFVGNTVYAWSGSGLEVAGDCDLIEFAGKLQQ